MTVVFSFAFSAARAAASISINAKFPSVQEYSGIGLGTRIMQLIEQHARKMNLEIIQLSVYEKNEIAQTLYKKMDFSFAGKIPNAVKREGKYDNEIIMYKVLK